MASADHDDERDDEDETAEERKPAAKKAVVSSSASSSSRSSQKPASASRDDDDREDDEEDEDEAPPPPKPASTKGARTSAAKTRGPGGPGAARGRQAAVAPSGSLGKSVLLFFVIVIGLGAGFAILGREPPAVTERPKWSVGQTVDVEVTLVKADRQELGCWSADEVAGKHCAFEAAGKPWSKGGDPNDDKTLLKPYTTTDRMQFTATGLWTDPGMAPDKLPAARFSVKCKYKVEGVLKTLGVRWEQTGNWFPQNDWYAGSISNCTLGS